MDSEAKIKLITSVTGCSVEEAQLAWSAADHDEVKAIELVDLIKQRYMVIKMHFRGSGMMATEGIAVIILEEKSSEPIYVTDVVINYSEDQIQLDMKAGVAFWQQLISSLRRDQNRHNMESTLELKEFLESRILPETGYSIWKSAREVRALENSDEQSEIRAARIRELQKNINLSASYLLETFYKHSMSIEVETEFLNNMRFSEISRSFGLVSQCVEKKEEPVKERPVKVAEKEKATILLKGRIVVDMNDGLLTRDLRKGDKIAVDIIDRSPVAEHLARMLGIKVNNRWQAAWGIIVKIGELSDSRRNIMVEIAKRVYVETIVMDDIKVKSKRKNDRASKREYVLETPSAIPGYLMVVGMAFFFSLLMKIFMDMVNR